MPNTTTKKKKKISKKRQRARKRAIRRASVAGILVLAILMLTGMSAGWFLNNDVMDVQASALNDDGMIRVYLKSLARPEALGLTLDGVFSVDADAGFRFARGSEITVACDEGSLLLGCGGMTINMGSSFTLTRHLTDDGNDTNGIYIHESEKDALFVGDLTLTNEAGGIDAILKLDIEEYLLGVVAYEMSDSFPVEALKAQAIAARTYAMRSKQSNKNRIYDVVDTTQDQVYKGYDKAFTRVEQAVRETAGIVGIVNGRFASCYYTASNGGQIATPKQIWGGDDGGYIVMKDDPYDLENPQSVVKRAVIPYTPRENSDIALALAEAVSEEMASLGFSDDASDIRIDRIRAITLANPDIEGSRMYKNIDFEFEASGRRLIFPEPATPDTAAPYATSQEATTGEATPAEVYELSDYESVPTPFKVRLNTYGQIEDMLSLSINSTNVEVFEVTQNDSGFTLISRRFGHGSGMSQRGAQRMAGKYGKSCEDILKFYYPGMSLEKIDWKTPALHAIESLPDSVGAARARPTPKPTPAPLRPLNASEYYAVVTLETASSSLNVRKEPTTSSGIAGLLSDKDRLIVIQPENDGWFKIETTELSGYVKGDYITRE